MRTGIGFQNTAKMQQIKKTLYFMVIDDHDVEANVELKIKF